MNSEVQHSPFSLKPVRTPEQFVGREKETRRVLSLLQRSQSVSILGPAKIGKTSFAFHVVHPATREYYGLAKDHTFIYLDCHRLSNCNQEQCYRTIREEMIHQIQDRTMASAAIASDLKAGIHTLDSATAFQGLQAVLRTLQTSGWLLVIVLDDFEFLAQNPQLEVHFFAALRSLATNYELAYLVTSQLPLDRLEQDMTGSPLWNIFTTMSLGALTPAESQELVVSTLKQAEIEFPLFAQEWIIALGNGEPHRLQKAGEAAFQVWREQNGILTVENYEEIKRQL
jgi:hypothetical protein